MSKLRRRQFLTAVLAAMAVLPLQPLGACISSELHQTIAFEDPPDAIPAGLVARHFHLTNQVPQFKQWKVPREVSFERSDLEMRHFSFIGLGAVINPWTHWLTSRMPDWLVRQPDYIPIFAPTSSCTERFAPLSEKMDRTVILVGAPVSMTNGNSAFAAASFREWDGRWATPTGGFGPAAN